MGCEHWRSRDGTRRRGERRRGVRRTGDEQERLMCCHGDESSTDGPPPGRLSGEIDFDVVSEPGEGAVGWRCPLLMFLRCLFVCVLEALHKKYNWGIKKETWWKDVICVSGETDFIVKGKHQPSFILQNKGCCDSAAVCSEHVKGV